MFKIRNKSFTLIEVLVVVGVMSIVLPTLFAIFFIIIRQQIRIFAVAEVKRQGDYVNTIIETAIRNNGFQIFDDDPYSGSANILCGAAGTPYTNILIDNTTTPDIKYFNFEDKYGNPFNFTWTQSALGANILSINPRINPNNPSAPPLPFAAGNLNNSKVSISSITMTCSRSSRYSSPIVTVSYDICYIGSQTDCVPVGEEYIDLFYTTSITIRNIDILSPTPIP